MWWNVDTDREYLETRLDVYFTVFLAISITLGIKLRSRMIGHIDKDPAVTCIYTCTVP